MEKIEYYECPKCGTKFEITQKQRMSQFILQCPQEWNCPNCAATCFALNTFSGSGGGDFNETTI